MNAMADAVENSEFVIMCMSDSYKQSTYCQAEAEYGFNCKRILLPLIVRAGYKPDGWLGFMIGSRMYVDFGRFDFNTACEKLMTEINLQRKRPPPPKPVRMNSHEKPTDTTSTIKKTSASGRGKSLVTIDNKALGVYMRRMAKSNFVRKPIYQWTESDVLDFLSTQRLTPLMPLCDTMDGRALIQLYKICVSHSSRAYTLLNDELISTYKVKLPMGIYTRFLSAVEQRLKTPLRTQPNFPTTTRTTVPLQYESQIPKTPVNTVSTEYASYPDQPYDLLITSNAPALQVLRAIERYGTHFQKVGLSRTRNSVPF